MKTRSGVGAEKKVGLARALSKMGICSRSDAAEKIRAGRVRVNGAVNKPRGIVTTAEDEKGRETVYALLPKGVPWIGPVGRLDKASEGLLILTNDTEWAARITAPESHVEKKYAVQIGAVADETLLGKLEAGVMDGRENLRATRATLVRAGEKNSWIEIVLEEGKNRQIRRMLEGCGVEVLRLIRVGIGGVELGTLAKGAAREMSRAEVEMLKRGKHFRG